ncbi:hypothetical protein RHGRI_016691 [Rhododendron griersonianum]|uniref:Uncharacterized protein n=1 Tax=Rhododendron griersonianum TaxID=479676 RepID=A0AAV6JV73_9ERIC|nr:hypothetical protein RHGRI_016691 [Rhododendron griersonianum]
MNRFHSALLHHTSPRVLILPLAIVITYHHTYPFPGVGIDCSSPRLVNLYPIPTNEERLLPIFQRRVKTSLSLQSPPFLSLRRVKTLSLAQFESPHGHAKALVRAIHLSLRVRRLTFDSLSWRRSKALEAGKPSNGPRSRQISDPSSGFTTVEKVLPGGLTPMLGDRKGISTGIVRNDIKLGDCSYDQGEARKAMEKSNDIDSFGIGGL